MTDTNKINTEIEEIFDDREFVFTEKINNDGKKEIIGGGYKIKSYSLQSGTPVMTTYNESNQTGGKVSSPFENLAVPAGLFYINMRVPKKELDINSEHYKAHETISDDMIDKLYALVEVDKKRKRKTRKNHIKQEKTKTRRHKLV